MSCKAVAVVQAGRVGSYAAEILFFLFKLSESMLEPSTRLFIYEGVCMQEMNSHDGCSALERHPDREEAVQSQAASYMMYYKMLINLPAIILVLLCGIWSDRSGRKLPVLLTCFGGITAVLLYMLSSYLGGKRGPVMPLVFAGAATRGAFGRSAVMTMSVHSYVADISTEEVRTRKLSYLVAMSCFGYLTGSVISGLLLDVAGYPVVFCIVIFLQCLCVLVAFICMRDTVTQRKWTDDAKGEGHRKVEDADDKKKDSPLCELKHCFRVMSKSRSGGARCYLLLLIIAAILQQTAKSGELDITLLFVQRSPLKWTKSTYSFLLAVDFACMGFLSFFILPVLLRCLHIADINLILLGVTFKVARTLMLAFCDRTWEMFVATVIGGPHAFAISGMKSLVSKLVDEDEIGKTFSVLSSFETMSNVLGSVLFDSIYSAALGFWPGTPYACEAALYVIMLLLMAGLACSMGDRHQRRKEVEEEVRGENNSEEAGGGGGGEGGGGGQISSTTVCSSGSGRRSESTAGEGIVVLGGRQNPSQKTYGSMNSASPVRPEFLPTAYPPRLPRPNRCSKKVAEQPNQQI